jgi:surfeit locus 1 family protein
MKKLIFFLVLLFILISLGIWQISRLKEKNEFIANLNTQLDARVVNYNYDGLLKYKYRKIRVTARLLFDKTIFYYRLNNNVPGYELLVPGTLNDGSCVLINFGWQKQKIYQKFPEQVVELEAIVTDLYVPAFMHPDNSLANNIWFDLDMKIIENHLGVSCEPYLLVVYSPETWIVGKNNFNIDVAGVPNNHLSYAVTWFLLAGAWVVVFVFYLKRKK